MKRKMVLYGAGVEGEKFYWKHRDEFEIEYCVDQNCHRYFHGIWVYSIDEVRNVLKEAFVVVAAVNGAYVAIEGILKNLGMREFDDYLCACLFGRKLAILYGNCHMRVLERYFSNNPWFGREYVIRRYEVHVPKKQYPTKEELLHCGLLIGQDIRENNEYGVPSIDALMKQTQKCCRCVKIPNLYGYNLFWPQIGNPIDYTRRHLNKSAIDIERYLDEEEGGIKGIVTQLGAYGDVNIERMYQRGRPIKDIVNCIRQGDMYVAEDIRKNFAVQIDKIKQREQTCDIQISDYIKQNYQQHQLFYDLCHPTEQLICEKGRRILHLLNIPQDEALPVERILDFCEMFIYGCVKSALGITYEQKFIRRGTKTTLTNRPVDLEEYVEDYIAWVCREI